MYWEGVSGVWFNNLLTHRAYGDMDLSLQSHLKDRRSRESVLPSHEGINHKTTVNWSDFGDLNFIFSDDKFTCQHKYKIQDIYNKFSNCIYRCIIMYYKINNLGKSSN